MNFTRRLSKSLAAAGLLALTGCSDQDLVSSRPKAVAAADDDFMTLVNKGAHGNYLGENVARASQFYSGGEQNKVTAMELDQGTGKIAHIAFDTERMDGVDQSGLDTAARKYVKDNEAELGLAATELVAADQPIVTVGEIAAVTYGRKINDVAVKDAYIQLLYVKKSGQFRLAEVINRSFGDITVSRDATSLAEADVIAKTGIATMTVVRSSELIKPIKIDAKTYAFVWARDYELKDSATGEGFNLIIAPATGKMLEARAHSLTASHRFTAKVYDRSYVYKDKMSEAPLAFAVMDSGNSCAGSKCTDEDGVFPNFNGVTRLVLDGDFIQIADGQTIISIPVTAGTDKTNIALDPNSNAFRALNAYLSVATAIKWVSKYLDKSKLKIIANGVTVSLNVAGSCNANYSGNHINLFAAGNGCANMALVNDVVYHEWGHGLDDSTGPTRGIPDGAFSEGIGDIVAAYLTNDSNMSPGFKLNREVGIRQLKNREQKPDSPGEVHQEGLVIGGTFWDMREALVQRYGQAQGADVAAKLFLKHLEITDRYTDSYRNVLRIDDNDNNPSTRSPNHCLITKAFANHGLATEEANCTDSGAPTDPVVDQDVKLAVAASGDSGLKLWGAAKGTDDFALCKGSRAECLKSKQIDLTFARDRADAGLGIYRANNDFVAADGQLVTLVTKDGAGTWKTARTVKLSKIP